MRVRIPYARSELELDLPGDRLLTVERKPTAPALPDVAAAVASALENPRDFPALRRALTPDDHVAIAIDDGLPNIASLVVAIVEHVGKAGVGANAITVVCPPSNREPGWHDELPAEFRAVRVEVHDPTDRKKLAYLAATRKGRRVYLNRTAVDADQLIILSRRGYDPLLGYSGCEGSLYPALSDEATRVEYGERLSADIPDAVGWPARQEAVEIAWLLGAPFFIQLIEGAGDDVIHVIGGQSDSSAEGIRFLDDCWRVEVSELADTVVGTISGSSDRSVFEDLARAAMSAARVVKSDGRIVLLTEAKPSLGPAVEVLRQAENPSRALSLMRKKHLPDAASAFLWASAAQRANLSLLSSMPADVVEDLFATPLESVNQAKRLLREGTCLILPDAHKTLAVPPRA